MNADRPTALQWFPRAISPIMMTFEIQKSRFKSRFGRLGGGTQPNIHKGWVGFCQAQPNRQQAGLLNPNV